MFFIKHTKLQKELQKVGGSCGKHKVFIGCDKSVEDLRRRSDITPNAFVIGLVRPGNTLATRPPPRVIGQNQNPDKFVSFNFNVSEAGSRRLVWNQLGFGYVTPTQRLLDRATCHSHNGYV